MESQNVEQILKVRQPRKAIFFKGAMIVLSLFSVGLIRFITGFGVILTACFILFTVLLFRYYNAEYEYELVDTELTVDRIMAKASRKRCGVYDVGRMEIMAPLGSEKIAYKEHQKWKSFDYSSNMNHGTVYVLYAPSQKEMVRVLLEPDEKMLGALKAVAGRKFYCE